MNPHYKMKIPKRLGRRYDRMDRKTVRMALCVNRHQMPETDGAIYPRKLDLQDVDRMNARAERVVRHLAAEGKTLMLYVSGAQYPLVAVINACIMYNVELILMHYNPQIDEYYPQEVYTVKTKI